MIENKVEEPEPIGIGKQTGSCLEREDLEESLSRVEMSAEKNTYYTLCPKCGYPNKPESLVCGFCQKNLHGAKILSFPSSNSARTRRGRRPPRRIGDKFLRILLGGLLFTGGGYLLYFSLTTSEFKLWLISLLCLLYGVQLVRPFLQNPLEPPK
ncbi:MAG: hypothetical protein HYY20_08145 [Candidatus Tectomicrobia bacterium]|uniref:Uncharacterized protein n=1 Tax=Tectimicrobiota bacterium TaxID=2528274 RepID=A0A932CNV6_UNCTE|nr:hypothetical protein [Candidatus Tectomicrobia bacterium]